MKNRIKLLSIFLCILLTQSSCEKDETETAPAKEYGSVTDSEGNTYKTIKIGNQWWMAEDLRTTKFSDGTSVSQMQDANGWLNPQPYYCIYDNSPQVPGLLYNWYAVMDPRGIAPEGWRIPTDEDWKELERYLEMTAEETDKTGWRGQKEGNSLKIEGYEGWDTYGENWPDNASGFSAIAGGCRLWNGTWGQPGLLSTGFWWTSSEHPNEEAWYRHLDYKRSDIFRYHGSKAHGFAIRCIKNN